MKTRTIVLNENVDAKHRWPTHAALVRTTTYGHAHCCLGCLGLAYEVPVDSMWDKDYLSECGVDLGFDGVRVEVPRDVINSIKELYPFTVFGLNDTFEIVASILNDRLAEKVSPTREEIDAVVKCIRILFTWAGEQLGERWVIRHLKDDRIFER